MTEQQETSETQASPTASPPPVSQGDWREQRRAQREARREGRAEHRQRRPSGLVWGGILILLGIVLLPRNAGFAVSMNWWAVFILLPAFWSFVHAWDSYRANGRLTRRAASSAVGGTLLTMLAFVLLFNAYLGTLWPLLLIAAGAALLLTGFIPE